MCHSQVQPGNRSKETSPCVNTCFAHILSAYLPYPKIKVLHKYSLKVLELRFYLLKKKKDTNLFGRSNGHFLGGFCSKNFN